MFKLNLKIALRNLWKNSTYALISIAGLAVALTIFILAALYANDQRRYDSWSADYQKIYRVNYRGNGEDVALSPGNMATYSNEKIAAVAAATRIQDYWWGDLLVKTKAKSLYLDNILLVDSNFFKVFAYPALYGNLDKAMMAPKSLVMSKETSEILFGKGVNPVGETIMLDNKEGYIIDAVVDEARYPSHFKFKMIRRFKNSASDDYYSNNYYTYVRLHSSPADINQTEQLFNTTRKEVMKAELRKLPIDEQAGLAGVIESDRLYLQSVADIHLTKSNVEYEFPGNGIGTYMYMMLVVAVLVIVIAAVNFSNLSVTMASRRAKETGVRKVLGAQKMQIGIQFIVETAMQCLLSFVLALVAVELLLPVFNHMAGSSIVLEEWKDYQQVLAQVLLVLLVLTFLVGLYPALMISNIIPAKVLKGNFGTSNSGALLRNVLIVVQFSIAVLFVSGIWIINSQLNYMQRKDLGYKPEQVLAISMMQDVSDAHFHQIKNTLKGIQGVNTISRADHLPGEDLGGNSYRINGKSYNTGFITVDVDYFSTLGMKLLEGREYSSAHVADTVNSIIITETAARSFNLVNPIGKIIHRNTDFRVIGLVKDFNHYSPEKAIQPLVFQYMQGNALRYVLVNIGTGNSAETLAKIEEAWQKLEPQFPMKYTFLDQTFAAMLHQQQQLRSIIGLLSVVTVVLALMGLFAIAAFNTQRRRKEIGIRKVLGASLLDILKLLNKQFVVLVLVANLIAWPIAYLVLSKWLDAFAFRIALSVLPFILSGCFTLLLTITIVSLQSYKSANANPVDTLKYE
ncbi:ABC transporter permease [Pedobacter sp. AW31-3R]|uniref:ABC transporter permease n=1 Tax=Pedobacter sp. AW31-3R TaxID=3445781 RepID=UPI003FA11315